MQTLDLSGAWRAIEADEELRRAYPEPDFADDSWAAIDVPSHWRSSDAFAESDGPLLYRRRFEGSGGEGDRRAWLVLDGVFYQTDVWLDGAYVGDTEGYFFPHSFEVTEALRDRSEHVLAVEVACSRSRDQSAKRNITGVFQHWDGIDPSWNPGGIWRGVRIEETGPVRISRLRTLCTEASDERAVVSLRAVLDSCEATTARVVTRVGGVEHEQEQPVAAGENRFTWGVVVEQPELWWPWSLGAQGLTDVSVEVFVGDGVSAVASDRRVFKTGLRQVRMKNWVASVNGERLFLKGSNVGPTQMVLAEAEAPDFERDVLLARDAGLDLLRVHGHISRPELYDAADRHGLLLWQDFPLQWGYARGIRQQAARQAREAVDLLGHHPSIALWCGHNEPAALGEHRRVSAKAVLQQQLPTWNKTLLDSTVRRAFERSDPSRPVVAHSGVVPGLVSGGSDSHLYFGWYHGDVEDLAGFVAAWPKLARFVSEFGAQAVPSGEVPWVGASGWPALEWDRLAARHGMDQSEFERVVPPSSFATFDDWRDATQQYQAHVIRRSVETLRRLKYRPTGGFCQMMLADSWPSVSWSVLGFDRMPKLGYEALREACQPVIVVADSLPASVVGGETLALDVHVVSDLRVALDGACVRAVLSWDGPGPGPGLASGSHEWSWTGDIAADSCARVGTIQFVVPEGAAALHLALHLAAGDITATNSY